MGAQPLLHLREHQLQEAGRVVFPPTRRGEYLVHKSGRHEILDWDALAHDEGFIGLGDSEALDEGAAGATFSNKT